MSATILMSLILGLLLGSTARVYSLIPAAFFLCVWVALISHDRNLLAIIVLTIVANAACQISFFVGAVTRLIIAKNLSRRQVARESKGADKEEQH